MDKETHVSLQSGKKASTKMWKQGSAAVLTLAIIVLAAACNTVPPSPGEDTWTITSPGGGLTASILLEEGGSLSYYVHRDGQWVIEQSPLGFGTSLGDFSVGLDFVSAKDQVIDESYQVLSGKASTYINHANEKTLRFSKGDMFFDVVFRAYDNGVAWQYHITRKNGAAVPITLIEETSTFVVPGRAMFTYQPNVNYPSGTSHEVDFVYEKGGYLAGQQTLPLMYSMRSGVIVLLNEAALGPQYCGSVIEASDLGNGMTILKLAQPSQQTKNRNIHPVSTTPFTSPWRYAVIGSYDDIINNTMAENLSPAPDNAAYKFNEWVNPGVVSWLWIAEDSQSDITKIRQYIDLSVEMGWKHVILDEGWQPYERGWWQIENPYNPGFETQVFDYAKEKGIGVFGWVHVKDLATPEKARTLLTKWKSDGITGIKADFFDNESQDTMKIYDYLYKLCAELKLLLLCHGANKPTGEIRTYPNLLGREGIRGEENTNIAGITDVYFAYTRAVVGPTDFTPTIEPRGDGNTTTSHKLALNIVYESGMPVMASNYARYQETPAKPFLTGMPARWDQTVFLGGSIDTYAALARRNGSAWYAAAINSADPRTLTIPLDFLTPGKTYQADIYRDRPQGLRNDMDVESQTVTSADTLSIDMNADGGFAVKFIERQGPL